MDEDARPFQVDIAGTAIEDLRDRLLHLPQGDLPAVPPLGGACVPAASALERARQGRHFAALEQPEAFVNEVRAAFRSFR